MKVLGLLFMTFSVAFADDAVTKLVGDGMAKMEQARVSAMAGKFTDANTALQEGSAALDKAIALEPSNYQARMSRAMMYGHLPPMYNKVDLAREDIRFLLAHTDFAKEPEGLQQAVRGMLAKLDPGTKHDRFPKVAADLSPIIVAATVTSPSYAGLSSASPLPPTIAHIMDTLKESPGLLGTRIVASLDKPGQIVVLTWWKDKAAVNKWFYSDAHQGLIREAYGNPGGAKTEVTQVGIELFSALPGGTQMNGGVTPASVSTQ